MILRSWVLVCLGLGLVLAAPADEAESAEPPLFDVAFGGETLQEAIAVLATLSDTDIEIQGSVEGQTVFATLEDATLEEGLRRLFSDSSYVMIRRADGGVTVLALGPAGLEEQDAPGLPDRAAAVLSVGAPGPELSAADLAYYQSQVDLTDPATIEILPPDKPGESGLTLAEINALTSQSRDPRSQEREVLPPDTPGGEGFTIQDLEALLDRVPIQRPLADELPPETY